MIIFQELRGLLLFSSTNGRDFQFTNLLEFPRSLTNLLSSSLSIQEIRKLEKKESLATHEVKKGEIFVLQSRSSSEVYLWSSTAGRALAVLQSEVSLVCIDFH